MCPVILAYPVCFFKNYERQQPSFLKTFVLLFSSFIPGIQKIKAAKIRGFYL